MPRNLTLLAALLALGLTACLRDRSTAAAASDVALQTAASGAEAFLRYGPVRLASSRDSLRQHLGSPDSVRQQVLTNPHDPAVTDTIFTLHYPGLVTEIYRASFDGRELLASAVISDNRHLRAESPLRIGMSAEEIRLALGEPDATEDGDLFYACATCGVGGQDGFELRVDGRRLRSIRIQYWID